MPQAPLAPKDAGLFRQVLKCYETKQYKKGLKAAEQILKRNPHHGETLAMKGLITNSLGRTTEAFAIAKEALKQDMKSHVCWHVYGLLYRSTKNFEESIKAYKMALRFEPESQQILRDLALLQIQMRDYVGYIESRRQILQGRPQLRQNWTGLAIAQHLAGSYAEAENVMVKFEETLKVPVGKGDVEHSEAGLYKNMIIAESGDIERALTDLEKISKTTLDKISVLEKRAEYLLKLERKEEAVTAYKVLLQRNAEKRVYYQGLEKAMGCEEDTAARKALYAEYAEKNQRSDAPRRIPLDFLSGDEFREAADAYLTKLLKKGVPSTFANVKALYADAEKRATILELVQGYAASLENEEPQVVETPTNGDANGNEPAKATKPSEFKLWTLYFLGQHYDHYRTRNTERSLEYINKALELKPEQVELHMTLARIYKHAGNLQKAMEKMNEARNFDKKDRYINTNRLLPSNILRFHSNFVFKPTRSRFRLFSALYTDMEPVNTSGSLAKLRELMKREKVDVYVVPSEDAHSSEYICAADARRAFICGFTGSAGCAIITQEKAALSTDGRYFNQAQHQLDSNWELLKQGLPDVPTWQEWVVQQAEGGKTVGVDATLITAQQAKGLETRIKKKGGTGLLGMPKNLIDEVWGTERPARPNNKLIVLEQKYAGKPFQEKLEALRKEMEKKKSPGFVVSMLDEIAWLYNLRGSDIPYNPVFFSYAFITPTDATLYIDSSKLDEKVLDHLGDEVKIRPYHAIFDELAATSQKLKEEAAATENETSTKEAQKWLVSNKTSWALSKALGGEENIEVIRSPIEEAKAVKNDTEREGMRNCHVRDGAALIEYFAWLENELGKGEKLDEVQAADKLEEIRSKNKDFMGLSFDTISSTGANAAVIHYKPTPGACAVIDPKAVYLCDSGAQYLDGTTDTTRTLHFGEPTDMERKAYTLVLKGMVALDRAVFPKGTTGFALDVLARQFLWAEGLDYRHGTGHGVGSFLNVHEGPIGIGTRIQYSEVPLGPGMVISDEPGYYEDGSFGIRIENIIMVKEVQTNHNFGERPYYGFEHVTMVPMCKKLTDPCLLTPAEKTWLNDYHAEVYEKTKGFFEKDSIALKWLERETAAI